MSEAEITCPAVLDTAPAAAPADPMAKARKEASGALFVIAFLQLVCVTALLVITPRLLGATVDPSGMALALGWTVGLGAVFAGLGVWARYRPLPAAAVGLGLYVLLTVAEVVSAPERVGKGVILRLILVALLAKAIRTCLKARPR
jgi:hypothetical protein